MCKNNTESEMTPVAFMIMPQYFDCYLHTLMLQFKTLKAFIRKVLFISEVYRLSIKSMFFLLKGSNLLLFLNICYQLTSVVEPTLQATYFVTKRTESDLHAFLHKKRFLSKSKEGKFETS